jgi:hypothetical protein
LGEAFLKRWQLSHTKYPVDILSEEEKVAFTNKIVNHKQWFVKATS